MPTYFIYDTDGAISPLIEEQFSDQDRCSVGPHAWFVRSQRLASAEVAKDLGIAAVGKNAIVVTAKHYAGTANRTVVEKLAAWESDQ